MFGPITRTPLVELGAATVTSSGNVNLFSGLSSSNAQRLAQLETQLIRFSDSFNMSWEVAAFAAAQRRHDREMEMITYPPTEVEIVITLTTTDDAWIAVGLTESGGMRGADIWLTYASGSPAAGELRPYFELSDRKATEQKITPQKDSVNNLRLISAEFRGGGGYTVSFGRALHTGDDEFDFNIADRMMDVVWATGPFDLGAKTPRMHHNAGLVQVNLLNGTVRLVPQQTVSFWFIAVLIGAWVGLCALSFVLRMCPPTQVANARPLSGLPVPVFLALATVPQILVLLFTIGLSVVWIYGFHDDLTKSRNPNAFVLALGHGSQFFIYFCFLPWLRHNPILFGVLQSYFHRANQWGSCLAACAVALAWAHGILLWHKRQSTSVAAGILLTLLLIVSFVGGSGRLRTILFRLVACAAVVFICIHAPSTALGLIPTFVIVCCDCILRLKDWNSRSGLVDEAVVMPDGSLRWTLLIRSPVGLWTTKPFVSTPSQFLFLYVPGMKTATPAAIAERVCQDGDLDVPYCTAVVMMQNPSLRLLEATQQTPLCGVPVRVEGPYGGMQTRLKWFRSLITIASGSDFCRILPILQALVYEPDYFAQCSSLTTVTVLWQVKRKEDFIAHAQAIFELLKAPRAFDLFTLFYAEDHIVEPQPTFVDITAIASPSVATEPPVHPLFMYVPILSGRPKWQEFFAEQQTLLGRKGELRTAVFAASHSSSLVDVVRATSALNHRGTPTFNVEVEDRI